MRAIQTLTLRSQLRNHPSSGRSGHSAALRFRSYYAKLKRAEDDIMAELAKKYRDRAKERRDGDATPAAGAQPGGDFPSKTDDPNVTASAYRAVAPDLKS